MQAVMESFDCKPLVESFAPLVKRLARQLAAKLPASVEIDDIVQAA